MTSQYGLQGHVKAALIGVADRLDELRPKWLIGGSCGLALRGIVLAAEPRDLDVYADKTAVEDVHGGLKHRCIDEPHEDETPIYRSVLSHYDWGGVTVELVGGFEVRAKDVVYRTEVEHVLAALSESVVVEGRRIPLMPLAHEFIFNVLRGRPDRYIPVAKRIRERNLESEVELLMRGNTFGEKQAAFFEKLLTGSVREDG